jgi:hypothetical protein
MDQFQFEQLINNMRNTANGAASMARQAAQEVGNVRRLMQQMQAEQSQMREQWHQWGSDASGLSIKTSIGAGTGRPDLLAIEDIPGRRVPFDIPVEIAIPANLTTAVTGTITLSMDGPFIAVARAATFLSSYTFQVSEQQSTTRYSGRSWGRQRPISSVLDINDALGGDTPIPLQTANNYSCPGSPPPVQAQVVPNNKSPFRSMEWDGFIEYSNQVQPRQNAKVPSSLWAPGWDQSMQLPVLDYFEKGEIIEFKVQPTHVNNPSAGNIQALLGSMPYLPSGYDAVEGAAYPSYACIEDTSDALSRSPDGVLYLHLYGFKILQPTGVAVR